MKIRKSVISSLILLLLLIFSLETNITYAIENTNELQIYSEAAIIIENSTGKILYEKNSEQKKYPASTTKIVTGILAIEKGNLQDKVTVSNTALAEMKPGYASAYLKEGEIISVEDLLKVLLIHSANDASNVLAEYISGSINDFVNLMNQKVKELGCNNTHFVTTNGLHDDNHYTTAKDLSTIARYCMQNSTFRNIVSSRKCIIPATNKSEERIYRNTNDLLLPTSIYYYQGCKGIKTGFTSEAKNCLVSACQKNGLQLIAVVLGASLTDNHRSARCVDSKTLYDYAYSNYSLSTIAKESSVVDTIEIKNGTKETKRLDLILSKDINAIVNNTNKENISHEIKLNDNIAAPIAANSVVGTVTYKVGDDTYTEKLLASHEVAEDEILIKILRLALIFILLIIFLSIIIMILKKIKTY